MLELHGGLGGLALPVVVLVIVLTVDAFEDDLKIGDCVGKYCLLFGVEEICEFEECLLFNEDIGAPLEVFEVLIVGLLGGVEYFLNCRDEALVHQIGADIAVRRLQQIGEQLLFEGLMLILSFFVLAGKNEAEEVGDRGMLEVVNEELHVAGVLLQEVEELPALFPEDGGVNFVNVTQTGLILLFCRQVRQRQLYQLVLLKYVLLLHPSHPIRVGRLALIAE